MVHMCTTNPSLRNTNNAEESGHRSSLPFSHEKTTNRFVSRENIRNDSAGRAGVCQSISPLPPNPLSVTLMGLAPTYSMGDVNCGHSLSSRKFKTLNFHRSVWMSTHLPTWPFHLSNWKQSQPWSCGCWSVTGRWTTHRFTLDKILNKNSGPKYSMTVCISEGAKGADLPTPHIIFFTMAQLLNWNRQCFLEFVLYFFLAQEWEPTSCEKGSEINTLFTMCKSHQWAMF